MLSVSYIKYLLSSLEKTEETIENEQSRHWYWQHWAQKTQDEDKQRFLLNTQYNLIFFKNIFTTDMDKQIILDKLNSIHKIFFTNN
jgi:hypothetical protein